MLTGDQRAEPPISARPLTPLALFALAQATSTVSNLAATMSKQKEAVDAVLNKMGEDGAKAEELRGMLAAAAEKEDRMVSILEGMKVKIVEGASAAEAAAAAAEAAAAVGGGAAMAAEEVAELRKEVLEGAVPALLDALEKEGVLTREAVTQAKEEILGKVADMGDKIEEVGRLWCCAVMEKATRARAHRHSALCFTDVACACRPALGNHLHRALSPPFLLPLPAQILHAVSHFASKKSGKAMPEGVTELDADAIDLVKGEEGRLGKGAQGYVVAGLLRANGKIIKVAIKSVDLSDPSATKGIFREMTALASLRHPHVVHIIGGYRIEGPWGTTMRVVLEHCAMGDQRMLLEFFAADPSSAAAQSRAARLIAACGGNHVGLVGPELVAEARRRVAELLGGVPGAGANGAFFKLFTSITGALEYIHGLGMTHGDIKSANILVDNKGAARLADFGLAKKATAATAVSVVVGVQGTAAYMATEVMRGEQPSRESDMYGVAVVAAECLTGTPPFSGKGMLAIGLAVKSGERPALPADAPPGLVKLVKRTWDANPALRPSALEFRHELLSLQKDGPGRRRSLAPAAEEGSLKELLKLKSLEEFYEPLKEQGFVDQSDFEGLSNDELEEIGKEVGMKLAHRNRFKKLKPPQVNKYLSGQCQYSLCEGFFLWRNAETLTE